MIFALGDEDHLDNCFGWTRQRHTYTPKGIGAKVLQLCRYFAYVVRTHSDSNSREMQTQIPTSGLQRIAQSTQYSTPNKCSHIFQVHTVHLLLSTNLCCCTLRQVSLACHLVTVSRKALDTLVAGLWITFHGWVSIRAVFWLR